MSYCVNCKANVTGKLRHCPLCQSELISKDNISVNAFPTVAPVKHPHRNLIRFIAFISIVISSIAVIVNISIPHSRWWSVFVVAGIVSLWISFGLVLKKRNNIPKNILWQVGVVSILAISWDLFTGFHRWSIDYVIPLICTCSMVAMAVTAKIIKLHIEDYIVYLIIDSIFAIVPLILILCGALNVIYPSAVCVLASIVSLSALLLFEGSALKAEILRRVHL